MAKLKKYIIYSKKKVIVALEITPSIAKKLPIIVKSALNNMSVEEQMMF